MIIQKKETISNFLEQEQGRLLISRIYDQNDLAFKNSLEVFLITQGGQQNWNFWIPGKVREICGT